MVTLVEGEVIINKRYEQLICGDAYDEIRKIPDQVVDLIIVDPPYELKQRNSKGAKGKYSKAKEKLYEDFSELDITNGIDYDILDEFMRIMKNPNIYIWCNKYQIHDYLKYFVKEKGLAFNILTWIKSNPMPLYRHNYMNDKEFCLYFKRKGTFHSNYQDAKSYWITPTNKRDKELYGHPTIKPEEIIEILIKNSSNEGDIVFDCFLGSGTTAAVAKRLNRNYIGIEISEKYYQIALERLARIEQP